MSANRMHFKGDVHFITNRCEHEMFLLLPTRRITEIIQGWFARALCLFGHGIEVYAFIFLANHLHLLLRDTKGTLAAFMWYFQGNVAKAINQELGRRGRFFAREYDDVIVPGDAELLDRYAYTLCNAVKAGLVDKSGEWPGWSSLDGALGDGKYRFEMLNQTKLHNATRRGQKVDESKFIEGWEFELAVPPMLAQKSKPERVAFIEELLTSAEREYRANRENKPALGVEKILEQRPLDRPLNPSFRPRIRVYCHDRAERETWLDGYRRFVGGYKEVFDGYRKAATQRKRPTVEWPEGSYPPACWYPVWHSKAA
jgi:REP element-mobilizing transposase RayT